MRPEDEEIAYQMSCNCLQATPVKAVIPLTQARHRSFKKEIRRKKLQKLKFLQFSPAFAQLHSFTEQLIFPVGLGITAYV